MSEARIVLSDDMREIVRRAILCFVATVNKDGTPNLSPKASLTVQGDALLFANIASPDTIANLRRHPAMELNVVDIFARRGYRFSGRGEVLAEHDPAFQQVARWVKATNGDIYPVFDVVRLLPSKVMDIRSPAYSIGQAREADIVATYRSKYDAI